jgi:hypothetical protein
MIAGWSRAIVLIAVTVLLGNVHCLGSCASASCNTQTSAPKHCHHHRKTDGDLSRCSHQHSEFTSPEAGFAKISLTPTCPAFLPVERTAEVLTDHCISLRLDTGPPASAPPDSSISVLRI